MDEFEAERAWAEKQFLTELRDDFAMSAITGILAGKWGQMPQYKPEEAFADFAYRIADEMIKRRNKHVDDEPKQTRRD
jgi:hypothetical protein